MRWRLIGVALVVLLQTLATPALPHAAARACGSSKQQFESVKSLSYSGRFAWERDDGGPLSKFGKAVHRRIVTLVVKFASKPSQSFVKADGIKYPATYSPSKTYGQINLLIGSKKDGWFVPLHLEGLECESRTQAPGLFDDRDDGQRFQYDLILLPGTSNTKDNVNN